MTSFGIGDFARAEDALERVVVRCEPDRSSVLVTARRCLLELSRYLGRRSDAERHADALVRLSGGRYEHEMALRRLRLCREGEPLARIVVSPDRSAAASETGSDEELREVVSAGYFVELDEASSLPAREYGFDPSWRRNRVSLWALWDFINAADEALTKHDAPRAVGLLGRAAQLDPLSPEPTYRLANLLAMRGDLGAAISAWSRTDELAPGWHHCRENIVLAQRAAAGELPCDVVSIALAYDEDDCRREWHRAFGHIDHALEVAPTLARLWLIRGYAVAFSDPCESAAAFARAVDLASNDHERTRALVGRGWHLEDRAERRKCLEEAMRLRGDFMDAALAQLWLLEMAEEEASH